MVPELLQYRKALNLGVCKSELKTAQFWFDASRQYHVIYDSLEQRGLCGSVIKFFFKLLFQRGSIDLQEPGDTQEACFQYPSDLGWLVSPKAKNVLIKKCTSNSLSIRV